MNDETLSTLVGFLEEDLGRGDVTTELVVGTKEKACGQVHSREPAVLAGLDEAAALASTLELQVRRHATDGDEIEADRLVVELTGTARAILGVERTLLNLMSHMSGVATLTRDAVNEVAAAHTGIRAPHPPRIAATRKTLPGLRALQKKAVVLGGGLPHRFDLSEAVLVKDNHLLLNPDITDVVRRARAHAGEISVEVEVESLADALTAARAGADTLLLDNLTPSGVIDVVEGLESAGLREAVSLEASGGINLETVARYADTGVDIISLGMLTTSVRHIDFSLHLSV